MRFKLDESMPVEVAELLNRNGHNASTVLDEQINGAVDTTVALACQIERRVLITLDLDFADIRAYPPHNYPGLIVLRLKQTNRRYVINFVPRLLKLLNNKEPILHRLWIVDEKKLRIRSG